MAQHGNEKHEQSANEPVKYQSGDENIPTLFYAGGFLAILVVGMLLVMAGHFTYLQGDEPEPMNPSSPLREMNVMPPEPRLQAQPQIDMAAFLAHEDSILKGYGWVDKKAGKVRIPVNEAIDLLVKQGLPVRKAGASATAGQQSVDQQTHQAQ